MRRIRCEQEVVADSQGGRLRLWNSYQDLMPRVVSRLTTARRRFLSFELP